MKDVLSFLADLRENNHREWFQSNRPRYESAKKEVLTWGGRVLAQLAEADPRLGHLDVKDTLFRINRDVRFSANKSPYKDHFGLYFCQDGRKSESAGYYIHIAPQGFFFGGGMYSLSPDLLKRVRTEIDYGWDEWQNILKDPVAFRFYGSKLMTEPGMQLSRPPKGYDDSNPAIEFLKYKQFVRICSWDANELRIKGSEERVAEGLQSLVPFIQFLNRAVENPED